MVIGLEWRINKRKKGKMICWTNVTAGEAAASAAL
jgi:hypothetical protein